jgi:hypothetical protein
VDTINRALTVAVLSITATALPLLAAGQALAGPVPIEDGGTVSKGRLHSADSGIDFALWVAFGGAVLVLVVLTAYVASSFRHHRRPARA